MAGVSFKFQIQGQDTFLALSQKLVSIDIDEIKKSIGQEMVEVSREHIETKMSPDGQPFKPWAEATRQNYARKKETQREILRDRQDLFNSITWKPIEGALFYGATMEYAGVHQFGWSEKDIPARPYLGIGMNEENRINDVLDSFLAEVG